MKIVLADPPNIDAIDAVFQVRGKKGVIFTWGDTIYNPSGAVISAPLKAHEGVHYNRQTNDTPKIEAWWERYLRDLEFRLAEEFPAHKAEYQQYCQFERDRNRRMFALTQIAERLAGPLYGNMITVKRAKELLR